MQKTRVAFILCLIMLTLYPHYSKATTFYDDFSADLIDRTKWANLEFVRQIENGKFISAIRRFGSGGFNTINVIDTNAVTALQADVMITEVSNTSASPRARLLGNFYNDGTAGNGLVGDISAQIDIRHNGTQLVVTFFVLRCNIEEVCNLDISDSFTILHFDDTTFGTVSLGSTHTLSLAFDAATTTFTFGFDGETAIVHPANSAIPPFADFPRGILKGLGTRVTEIDSPTEEGFIVATFDNVFVNGTLYDNFEANMIDRTKWQEWEFVREIANGKLVSKLTRFGLNGSNTANFLYTNTVTAFQADVAVTEVSNTGAFARARLTGYFYNDGTPGGGESGEVQANIEIRHNGTALVVVFFVGRCGDFFCTDPFYTTFIFDDTTFGTVSLGSTHTLFIVWNGTTFTFGFDGRTASFDPTAVAPVAGPSQIAFKGIGTRVSGIDSPAEGGFIAATFDNVTVTKQLLLTQSPLIPG